MSQNRIEAIFNKFEFACIYSYCIHQLSPSDNSLLIYLKHKVMEATINQTLSIASPLSSSQSKDTESIMKKETSLQKSSILLP